MASCQEQVQDEVDRLHVVVTVSVVLTVGMMIVRRIGSAPPKVFYGMGAVKLLLAVLMVTVFYPGCPDGCVCSQPYFTYPIVVVIIGLFWIFDGYRRQKASDGDGGEGPANEMPNAGQYA